jgi:PAS domain S-box-containing protein
MSVGGPSGSRLHGEIRLVIVESPDLAEPLVGALDVADVGAWVWIEADHALYLSPRVLDLLGLEREGERPLLARFLAAVHPDDRERVRELLECELPDGPFVIRSRFSNPDGSFRWIENRGRVARERDGSLCRQGGAMRDVSREVEQEQARARATADEHRRRQFDTLLTNIAADMVSRAPDELSAALSPALGRIASFFGASLGSISEITGDALRVTHWWVEPASGRDRPFPIEINTKAVAGLIDRLRDNRPLVVTTIDDVDTPDAREWLLQRRLQSFAAVPVRRDGNTLATLGLAAGPNVVIDWPADTMTLLRLAAALFSGVIARQRAEAHQRIADQRIQEAQKLESLGILAGGIAHDFNNLLTAILGNASLLRAEYPDEAGLATPLEQIEIASRRAADLCRQLLAYAGKGRFALQAIDVNELVREAQPLLEVTVPRKATLELQVAPDLPAVVGDSAQLRQALMNLVLNAAETIGEHGGAITIATGARHVSAQELATTVFSPELQEGPYVSLSVRDTGAGMSADILTRIFDPFFTTKFTGRGLGLPAVVGIVRAHKGALRVESAPDAGSTFELLLRAQPGRVTVGARHPDTPDEATLARWRVTGTALVIDDEAGVRELMRSILQRAGMKVETAVGGREGVERFRSLGDAVRIVFVDLTMPQLDGREALAAMRAIRSDLTAVLMSGYTPDDLAASGAHGFLQKPFTPYTVRRAMWLALTPNT